MLGRLHIMAIVLCGLLVALISYRLVHSSRAQVERALRLIAIISLTLDPIYWLWEYQRYGQFQWSTTLPLYLCSLFWILLPLGVFLRSGELKQIALANVATIGLISGVLGFVLNYHVSAYPFFSFVPLRSLLFHFLMILGSSLLWVTKYYQPQPGDQWRAFIPVGILLIPAYILNRLYGYDYGYTAGGQGTPIALISSHLPQLVFLVLFYSAWFLLVWGLFYRKLPLRWRSLRR